MEKTIVFATLDEIAAIKENPSKFLGKDAENIEYYPSMRMAAWLIRDAPVERSMGHFFKVRYTGQMQGTHLEGMCHGGPVPIDELMFLIEMKKHGITDYKKIEVKNAKVTPSKIDTSKEY